MVALSHDRISATTLARFPRVRALATWLGLAAIVTAGILFTGASPFPGWIALLPIGGALLVIAAWTSRSRIQRPLLLASHPVQAIGDWSYSIYLWHWPLIVIVPYALGHPLGLVSKVGIQDLLDGYAGLWGRWADSGKRVYVIGDVPLMNGASVPECVGLHLSDDDPCAVSRAAGLVFDPVPDAVAQLDDPAVSLVDLTDAFCDTETCHAVIGGVIAFRDPHHLSATFALTLIPALREQIVAP